MKKNKQFITVLLLTGIVFVVTAFIELVSLNIKNKKPVTENKLSPAEIASEYNIKDLSSTVTIKPTFGITPTATPTSKPLTFAEMNKIYGPCTVLPVLMYHHIQDMELAKKAGHEKLTVSTTYFDKQLEYLKLKNYVTVTMSDLADFFDQGKQLPKKALLLTFDDGYDDFFTDAWPILEKYDFKATLFVPTGLIDNSGYLTWDQIKQMSADGKVLFANHTWSHKDLIGSVDVIRNEIRTADGQLGDRNYNNPKIFAYPYGQINIYAEKELQSENYKMAFTTKHGSILCKQQRFELPRVRIGNAPMNEYGF